MTQKPFTVRDLDNTIAAALAFQNRTAGEIAELTEGGASITDVGAALRLWERNGWAKSIVQNGLIYWNFTNKGRNQFR